MFRVRLLPFVLALVPASLACVAKSRTAEAPVLADTPLEPAALLDGRPPRPLDEDGFFYVLGEDPAHPRVRTVEGTLSLNDSCMIRVGNKLSRRVPPMYVNGQPVGFC